MASTQLDTDLLLPRIARGDPLAVEACIARYSPVVWSIAKRMVKDPFGLEEVVQEIFVDLWKTANRFDPSKASEITYVAMIARRKVIDRFRRETRAPATEPIEESDSGAEDDGLEQVDKQDEASWAMTALNALKPDQRRLILMSVVDGLTHQEIATSTGLPLGTIKSHIRRGLDRAATLLGGSRGTS